MNTEFEVYNPKNLDINELPVIYGFNNGGSPGWLYAQLIAEDGTPLGSHICSHECFMGRDLGILKGARPDRHEGFREHYPEGYRMEWTVVGSQELKKALENNKLKYGDNSESS